MWDQVTLNIPSIQRKAQMRLPSSLDPDELDEDEDSHVLSKLHISTEVPSSTDESSNTKNWRTSCDATGSHEYSNPASLISE